MNINTFVFLNAEINRLLISPKPGEIWEECVTIACWIFGHNNSRMRYSHNQ